MGLRVEQAPGVSERVVGERLRPDEVGSSRKLGDFTQVVDEWIAVEESLGRQLDLLGQISMSKGCHCASYSSGFHRASNPG